MSSAAPVSKDLLARIAERQTWITPKAEIAAQNALNVVYDKLGVKGREILHGTPLHEPLHSVIVTVPLGAWTAALLFDTIGAVGESEKFNFAADASVVVGLFGAVGASVTGTHDWAEVKREAPRKVGAVHAVLNVAASALFIGSLVQRRKNGSRAWARGLATIGYVIISVSSPLGGNMIYEHGIGVEYGGKRWQD